ncbi:MAG: SDR family oxidoreductase [Balneolaceae bacterium]|nr:SDR family oxidoreductase [Balneolaceae bacterium]
MSKNIVLIGGSTGIGLKLAELLKENHSVTIISRNNPGLDGVTHHQADITKDELPDLDEPIQGFVYLPGSINLKPFKMLREENFKDDFEINFLGAVKAIKKYEDNLKESNGASVVMFSTVAVQQGLSFHASISAAKGAVEGFVRSMAAEYAPNIRFNAIAPSIVDTPLAKNLLRNDKQRERSEERHPLKRIGKPKDIAEAAKYLLSDESDWMTGQILHLDGGLSSIKQM